MKEAFVRCQGLWWHFFLKPLYGLCFQKKEQGRFSPFEVLLPEACEDFCVLAEDDVIHLICQEESGNILYLSYDDGDWHKTILLESKSPSPYPKHFSLIPVGNFLNLFYILAYKERHMLIHQILTGESRPPAVIDHIKNSTPPYLLTKTGTDIHIYYESEAGISGHRTYRWSRKELSQFVPLCPEKNFLLRGLLPDDGGRMRYAALQNFNKIHNLIYFEKTAQGAFTEPVTLYLDVSPDCTPIFCEEKEKLYLLWLEKGSVMSAYSVDDGKHWSKPVRYMKGAATKPRLYHISRDNSCHQAYGYEKEGEAIFYVGTALPEAVKLPKKEPPTYRPEGYDAAIFAESMGANLPEEVPAKNPMLELLQSELSRTKEQLFSLRQDMAKLNGRVEKLESGFVDTKNIL